jgi:Fur family ferric uptake transcriptional regulator
MAGLDQIATRIAARGGRVTRPRAAVFGVLLDAGRALTHDEIATALVARGVNPDRVTLYRNLDWLVTKGLAHRVTGADRINRFNAAGDEDHGHVHFHCDACKGVFCMESMQPTIAASLPAGFSFDHAELTLHGRCPGCR